MQRMGTDNALRIVLVYAVITGLWILLSDWALAAMVTDPLWLARLEIAQGWILVLASASLLYVLLRYTDPMRVRAEMRQHASDTQLAMALDNATDAIITIDAARRIIHFSPGAEQSFGYCAEEVRGQPFELLLAPDALADYHQHMRDMTVAASTASGTDMCLTVAARRKDKSIFPAEISIARLEQNGAISFTAILRDITRRVQIEHARTEEQLQYQVSLLQNVSDAIISTDTNFAIQSWNKAAATMYGWQSDEVIGKQVYELLQTEYPYNLYQDVLATFLEDGYWQGEVLQRRKDGAVINIQASVTALKDNAGNRVGAVAVNRDITQRKQAEEALKKERDFISAVLDTSGALVVVLNTQGRIVRFNRACEQATGYRFEEVRGRCFWDIFLIPEEIESVKVVFERLLQGDYPNEHENYWVTKSGERRMIAWSNTCLLNSSGAVEYIISTGIDITMRKRWERELRQRNRELTTLNTITAAVSSSLDLTEVFTILNTLLAEQLHVTGGALYFYDKDEDMLALEASWGLPTAAVTALETLSVVTSHNKQVVQKKEALFKPDFRAVEQFLAVGLDAARPDWQSYLGIPLLARGEIQGVVDLFSQSPTVFSSEQVAFFKVLGQQVGVAIHNARLFEQVRDGHERLQTLSRRLLEGQEVERRTIARELHDEIGQALTAVKINLQAMQHTLDVAMLGVHLEESIEIVNRALQQVRNLSLDLRPSILDDLGLVAALRWYLDRQARLGGFAAKFTADLEEETRLPPDLETVCFRVGQEALTNVVRHAQAHKVRVALQQRDVALYLVIRDDGVGFDVRAAQARAMQGMSLGLLGMYERVTLAGGQIEITSAPEDGTEVWVRFPLAVYGFHEDLDKRSSAT